MWANETALRQALDQLSASYADAQRQLRERDAAVQKLTESLAVARTESEMFQKLWTQAEWRAQTLGADLTEPASAVQQRQWIETLRALYLAESERQQLVEQMRRLIAAVESHQQIAEELDASRSLLAGLTAPAPPAVESPASLDSARVLDVNPKLRLVVLNVGAQQGARVGMPLEVFRGDRPIGRARIVEVRQRVAGALMESVDNKRMFQAGDTARLTNP